MSTSQAPVGAPHLAEPPDFSLVLGGPLYQLWRRTRLAGDGAETLLRRRVVVFVALAWLPLLLLALLEGRAFGDAVPLTFVRDVEMHARLLIALPLLIAAERVVHERMRPVVRQFLARDLIPDASRARFDAAVTAAVRLRNSIAAEVLMLAFVYGVGVLFVWRTQVALDTPSWYGTGEAGRLQPSLAGWWLGCVSMPAFQFLLLRWYFRVFVWARFLWHVSRIDLGLMPLHPDRCGGLGFLGGVCYAFTPVLVAQGALTAGMIANRIFHAGAALPEFKLELAAMVGVMLFAVLGPLLVFVPALAAAKRVGTSEHGLLAQRYVREYDRKWLRGGAAADEPLIGSPDIQSLADLNNTFAAVREMRWAPFSPRTMAQLAVAMLLPAAPLLLTMVPLEELLTRMLAIAF